jgi:predicted phage terminase large subunit-like protein
MPEMQGDELSVCMLKDWDKPYERLNDLDPGDKFDAMQKLCLVDLYFLAKYVLGYTWLTGEVHVNFCLEIEKDENMSLYLLPRGHCKTQLFTIADTIRHHLIEPSIPIFVVCDALKRSVKKTRAIKWHFEKNIVLRELFSDLIWKDPERESPKWTDEEFILPGHDGRQEPSILATSLENQPTGLHSPRIKCDDIVTPETVTTKEQIDKNRDQYGLMRSSILQAGGNIQIAGTIYDDGDLHCDMMREGSGYKVYRKPAIDDQGNPLWKEQFDIPVLEKIRRDPTVGDHLFSCQYLLDPVPRGKYAYFNIDHFKRYREIPPANRYVGLDFALSEKQKADSTVVMVAAYAPPNLFIEQIYRGKLDAWETVNLMFAVQEKYKPLIWACQRDMIRRSIAPFLRRKMMETGIILNVDDSVPMRDKMANARSIQGRLNEGLVYLPERGQNQPSWLSDFEHELRRFPHGRHDDMVDAFAFIGYLLDKIRGFYVTPTVEIRKPPKDVSEVAFLELTEFHRQTEITDSMSNNYYGGW